MGAVAELNESRKVEAKKLVSLSSLSREGSLMFQVAIKRENLVAEIQTRLSESWSLPECHLLIFVEKVSPRTDFLMDFTPAGQNLWQVCLDPSSLLGTEL